MVWCACSLLSTVCGGGQLLKSGFLENSWRLLAPILVRASLLTISHLIYTEQGYINRCILLSGIWARRVSCEHVENMELRCALVLRAPCSVSQSTVLGVSEHCALGLREPCSKWDVLRFSKYLECAIGAENICFFTLGAKAAFCGSLQRGKSIRRIKRNNCIRGN